MTETQNPDNYVGATTTIVGYAGGEPVTKEFSSGNSITELSISVGQGYKKDGAWVDTGTTWYTLTATADYAADNWPYVGKGDKVRVDDARQETREYTNKADKVAQQITLKYGEIKVLESKQPVNAGAATEYSDDTPF